MSRFKRISSGLFVAVLLMGTAAPLHAEQEQGGAGSAQAGAGPQFADDQKHMEEMVALMMGRMMEGMAKSMAKKEFAENLAIFTRSYYEALLRRGFTEEQAMQIVTAVGIPTMSQKR